MSKFHRHLKLWHKFIANLSFERVSGQRKLIKIFKAFWFLVAWPFELFGDLLIWPRLNKRLADKPKILIVKVDQLGDVLFSTFLLSLIKEKYPKSQIDYLINPRSTAVLQNNPSIHQVYYWQDIVLQNIPGRQKFSLLKRCQGVIKNYYCNLLSWCQLYQQNYDVIINARAFWPSNNWPWFLLGAQLIAFDFSQASCLANYRADYDLKAEEWQNYLNLLLPLGINLKNFQSAPFPQYFFNFLPLPQSISGSYWCLSSVSFDPERTWSIAEWVEFIKVFLTNQPGISLVLTGLPDQVVWLQQITSQFVNQPRIFCWTGLSIPQLASLIKDSQGFVGLDSFAAHLAVALDKTVFCLVNSQLFYVSGLSQQSMIDGRCMLPQSTKVTILDLLKTQPSDLAALMR